MIPHPDDDFARHKKALENQKKIEEALEKIDELIRFNAKYNKPDYINIDLKELKEILEK